ncbi:TorS-related protein [Microbispora rosea subsp. aerata]|nr:ATP-binding SpoIIE family protein phosphatase [Microbispora rosea]GGO29288.1 TorS-related protein [Microbispora rosea subsp. aerata]GIH58854.1 TorS-related protein [Microbispora rosea subsp. aerata]GLJ83335.1 TorS-related protein [Microbispora rosea subsp. aerata]
MTHRREDVWVRTTEPSATGAVRRAAVDLATASGFDRNRSGQVAVAVTEAVSNLVKHAAEGTVLLRPHPERPDVVELVALDKGPGIPDFARALRDGYSTSGTLGIGLGAIARMATDWDVHSILGRGTVLVMHFTRDGLPGPPLRVSGLRRPAGEERVCGDSFAFVDTGVAVCVLLCDGLGHGGGAAHASREAVRIFRENPCAAPAAALERVHRGLGHTRGGAVAVVRVGLDHVTFAGLGNVSGWIAHAGGRQAMISLPGVAGHKSRRPRQYEYALPPHATVVLHSDGLTDHWDPASFPGLFAHSPAVVGATLLRDAGSRGDDACVVAVRQRR